jgi:hypothetical protein
MRSVLVVVAICSASVLSAAGSPGPQAPEPVVSPKVLAQQGLVDELIRDPSGDLITWDLETGRGFVFGMRAEQARVMDFHGPASPRIAVSPGGRRAFLTDVNRTVEVHLPDGSRRQLDLGQQVGGMVWLDDRRLAVSPNDGDHLIEVRDVESGELVQEIEETPRISEAPGFRLFRATALAWDPERHRLHILDAFNGHYRVYDLSKATPATVLEGRIDDRGRAEYEEQFAQLDRRLAEQGEFQGASVWRFSAALDAHGVAWMVERCDMAGGGASSAGTAHLLAVDPEGAEHRLAVETDCCSLTAVPWGDHLAFAQAARPDRAGCFATALRPSLDSPAVGSAWLEVTPLSPRPAAPSRRGAYGPSVVRRLGPQAEPAAILSKVARRDPGLSLVCIGGGGRALACSQVWLDPEAAVAEYRLPDERPGRPVTGRVTLEGVGAAGASIALVPAEFRTTRLVTLPLALPEGAREPVRKVSTDAGGRFTLPVLVPGDYRLALTLPGGRMDQGTTFTVAPPTRPGPGGATPLLDLGTLDFGAGLRLEVAVTGPDGRPIPGAEAGAAQEAPTGGGRAMPPGGAVLYRAGAGEDGRAAIDGLAPDLALVVSCRAPGHDEWRESFDTPPPFVACILNPLARITGRVVNEDGDALPDARVTLTGGSPSLAGAVETAAPDDEGRFHFEGLEPGLFRLVAASPGRSARTLSLALAPGEEAGGDRDIGALVLEPGARWTHRVVDGADGEPVAGAVVTAVTPPGGLLPATTDARGEVDLEGPATGSLTVEARAEGFAPARVEVPESARSPDGEPHKIVLERGGWIVAHAWDPSAAAPCAGCRIGLSGRGPAQSLVTDASGTARSEPLAPGTWQASLTRLQGYGAVVSRSGGDDVRTVTVTPGATAEVRFGDPDDTLEVMLSPPPAEPGAWRLAVRDAAGAVRLHLLDSSGSTTVRRPAGGAVLSLMGGGLTIEVGTLSEDAADPTLIECPSGLLTARLPLGAEPAGPVWLELVDLRTGRRAAEIQTTPGSELRIPFLADGVYELRLGGRSLATASVLDGQETVLGKLD